MAPMLNMESFFSFEDLLHADQFSRNVFDHLGSNLESWLRALLKRSGCRGDQPVVRGKVSEKAHLEGMVYVAEGANIEAFAYVCGPAYIGPESEVRHSAYIRGNTYVGRHTVVGHSTEVKGSVFLDHAKAGHFAYVGDSILGRRVNLGAGTKCANFKFRGDHVFYRDPESDLRIDSGLRKFGAILGDDVNTGCNSVLDPGALLFPKTAVYPCQYFRGTLRSGRAK